MKARDKLKKLRYSLSSQTSTCRNIVSADADSLRLLIEEGIGRIKCPSYELRHYTTASKSPLRGIDVTSPKGVLKILTIVDAHVKEFRPKTEKILLRMQDLAGNGGHDIEVQQAEYVMVFDECMKKGRQNRRYHEERERSETAELQSRKEFTPTPTISKWPLPQSYEYEVYKHVPNVPSHSYSQRQTRGVSSYSTCILGGFFLLTFHPFCFHPIAAQHLRGSLSEAI